ncbi:MAG: PAS domain S-box protein [Woeseiaceae bacterium]|nr:PAS domain S-box protein [Woeseiaceae bacterium]
MLRSSNEAIVVADHKGAIVFVNGRAEALFGYQPGELLGQNVEILIPDTSRDRHTKHRKRFHEAPHARPLVSALNLKGRRKTGETFDAEISLTPIETGEGMLVSSRIREIADAGVSETYFRHILETAPDAMIIIDRDGRIAIANDQAIGMFGYTRELLIGRPVEMLLPESLRERHVGHRDSYAEDPHVRPMGSGQELLGRRADGTTFPVEISLSPVTATTGAFVSSAIRDVTDRKKIETELIEARQAAERANKANSAFLAAASHDLRQPVQALSLLTGALRRTVKTPLALEMLESQQHSIDAMTNLLNSLLDISRLDAGAVKAEFEEFPIRRLIDRLSAEFARQARQKGLKFEAASCEATVRSDPNLLAEIIQNLVSNAIRYTKTGKVELGCTEKDDELCLHVRDTGIGIEEQHFEAIFREFHQIKVPGLAKQGFGLGLAIVRRMANLLGVQVQVESTPGQGSCFTVCVPRVSAMEDLEADVVATQHGAERVDSGGLVILIEDDEKVAGAWGMLLEAEGFRVATAASAAEARAVVQYLDRVPDLIISDFHLLDGSTGVDAVGQIRATFKKLLPAFIVSGDTSKVVQDARSLENSIFMSKPVDIDQLLKLARAAIATGRVPGD